MRPQWLSCKSFKDVCFFGPLQAHFSISSNGWSGTKYQQDFHLLEVQTAVTVVLALIVPHTVSFMFQGREKNEVWIRTICTISVPGFIGRWNTKSAGNRGW